MILNTKTQYALFGTSADPPTLGHKKILEELSKIYSFTFTYASSNPQKKHKEDISIRSLLLKTLVEDLNDPKIIFDQEISSQWAIESIKKFRSIYKYNQLDFVIGSDLISDIFSWKDFHQIIKEVNFFVIIREGFNINSSTLKKLKRYEVNFKISTFNIPNISSSMVRLSTNYSNLPKSLRDIVKKNKLYVSTKLEE